MKKVSIIFLLFFITIHTSLFSTDTIRFGYPKDTFKILTKNNFWRITNHDSLRFKDKDYDDSKWVKLDSTFTEEKIKSFSDKQSIFWVRTSIETDTSGIGKPIALSISGDFLKIIYFDGKLLDTVGIRKKDGTYVSDDYSLPILISLSDTLNHSISIKLIYTNDDENVDRNINLFYGIFEDANTKNKSSSQTRLLVSAFLITCIVFTFTLFFIHLLMFFYYRRDLSNLFLGLFNLSFSIFWFYSYIESFGSILNIDKNNLAFLEYSFLTSFGYFFYASVFFLFFTSKKIFKTITIIYVLFYCVFLITHYGFKNESSDYFFGAMETVIALYSLVLLLRAVFKKKPGARIIGFGLLAVLGNILLVVLLNIIVAIFYKSDFAYEIGRKIGSHDSSLLYYFLIVLVALIVFLSIFSVPISLTAFLAWRFANTSKNLQKQLINVESLSNKSLAQEKEKQEILANQNLLLESEVLKQTEEIRKQKTDIELEKVKSDRLLLNILPEAVAEELKETGDSKAQHYEQVSVIFTDFVNFTSLSEKLSPEQLIEVLNYYFTAFDHIMQKYGMEKIKTIGDAYLAVSGLPAPSPEHAINAVKSALEILNFMDSSEAPYEVKIPIRIGVHSGPLVAGIVGVKKFAYDIWGDTVNTAARMEQYGEAGKVNISDATYQLIKEDFKCESRGKIAAKNKGEIEMYFLKE